MNMKTIEFSKPSYTEWEEEAVKALKGKPFESLLTKTIENITLEPLYTNAQLIEKYGEQLEKQVATIRQSTKEDRFATAQQIVGATADEFIANLEEGLARGNEVITIDSRVNFDWDELTLTKIADYLTEYPFKLIIQNDADALLKVFTYIAAEKQGEVEGYIVANDMVTLDAYPKVRTVGANTIPFHNNGANAVQELAAALAIASESAAQAPSFAQFTQKFFVNFAVDTQFFMEIAKIRAFRVLWKAFTTAYGSEASVVPIVAETSVRSFSKLDVYVNLLRAGNETFAAAIGGADVFTIHPHDILTETTEQSVRIARNVSLVTKEESHVLNVLDPAGGAYFVESLTADLVKEAWTLFLKIEEAGGMTAYATTFKEEVSTVYQARLKDVATRKHSLIGTNIYANPKDTLSTVENAVYSDVLRLAKPFEALRTTFAQNNAKIAILTYGELKNYKPRADFVAGFFATAGVIPSQTEGFTSIEAAQNWLRETDANYVIISATDEDTKQLVPVLLEAKPAHVILDAAGRYKDEQQAWQEAGLNGFIAAGQNVVQKLNEIAAAVEGAKR